MNDVKTQILAIGETHSLFEDSLNTGCLHEDSLHESSRNEDSLNKDSLNKTVVDSCSENAKGQAGSARPASIGSDIICLNVHQAELPLGLQDTSERFSNEQRQVEQLEIPISTAASARISQCISQSMAAPFSRSNLVSFKNTNHQVAINHSTAQGKSPRLDVANMHRSQHDLSDALEKSADIEGSDIMPAGCINRTKPSPIPDIENSARHFEAAMTLAEQLRSKQKPAGQEQSLNENVASSIDPFYSEKADKEKFTSKNPSSEKKSSDKKSSDKKSSDKKSSDKNSSEKSSSKKKNPARQGNAQTSNLRQRCIYDLEEARRFVKRSKESLVDMTNQPQTIVAEKKDHQQIGYQRSLLNLASTDSTHGVDLAVIMPSVQKKIRVNVKKKEQQKRKQAGILICRHLVAALKIQAAHDQNAITN